MTKQLSKITVFIVLMAILVTSCAQSPQTTQTAQPSQSANTPVPSESSESPPLSSSEPAGTSAAPSPTETSPSPTESQPESGVITVEHSTLFSVEYIGDNVKLVTDASNRKLLLVPRGQEAPAGYEDATVIETPVERAVITSITQAGMLRPYGVWNSIAGICSGSAVETMDQEIAAAGADVASLGAASAPDYEQIQALNPDIVFIITGSPQMQPADIGEKLDELGIPYAVDNEYMEQDHMGRMEWTKFLAAFFNKDKEAMEYADAQLQLLADMEERIAGADKPKVAWGQFHAASGVVYVPGNDSYVAGELRAAGCEYVFSHIEGAGSSQITVEEFYNALLEAEIWIYSSTTPYMPDYDALIEAMPIVADAPAVVNKRVWNFPVDFYYYTDQAAQQVAELAAIFHPDLYPDFEHVNFNPLAD